MAGTVVPNLSTISLCEATTGWSLETGCSGAPTLTPAPPDNICIQGNYSVYSYVSGAALRGQKYDLGAGGTDLRNLNIYCWFSFSNKNNIPVKGSTGMRLRVYDTSSNWSEWDIFGSDTLPHGGWLPWVVNMAITPSRNSGTAANLQYVRYVGWICGGTVTGKTYIYHDAWRYGTGLQLKGGTSGSPATFADLYSAEVSNAYGVVDRVYGVYFVQGKLTIGSTTGGDSTYFADVGQVVVFKDGLIPNGFYDIALVGNATGTTEVYFGDISGGRGVQGCLFKTSATSQTPKFTVTATDTNITAFAFLGCTFQDAGIIHGQNFDNSKLFIDCSFVACARMEPEEGLVQYCTFISAPGSAVKMSSLDHTIMECNFISCSDGVEITAAGNAYPFPALMFSQCVYDVNNSSSGAVYIDPTDGSNVSNYRNTGGGSTTINAPSLTLTITGLISGSDVVIYESGTTTVIEDSQENSGSTYAYYYPSTDSGNEIDVGVYKAGYRPKKVVAYALPASSGSLPITQTIDPDYVD